jgi:hypothetical protein
MGALLKLRWSLGLRSLRLRPSLRLRRATAALWALGVLAGAGTAWARAEAEVGYTREQTFSAALRYLRVDLAYDVTEKDADAAYLLFSFAAPELQRKVARGSIEVVQRQRTVRLFINLPELPSYREEVLKRGLLEKLHTEYGEPAPREEQPPEKARDKPKDEPKAPPSAPEGDSPAA